MSSPLYGDLAAASARGLAEHPVANTTGQSISRDVSGDSKSDRLSGIDAARGMAMILVCLSHVRYHFDDVPALYFALTAITRVATPTFLLLSGFVAAYVLSSRRQGTRIAVIDRGLFVLVVGHLLLNLEELPQVGFQEWLFARVTVTDAIAICLVIGALCVKVAPRLLLLAGFLLAFASWPIANTTTTEFTAGQYVLLVLFDAGEHRSGLIDAALAPYLGVFLIGMGLSKLCMPMLANRDFSRVARKLFITGAVAITIVLALAGLWHEFKAVLIPLLGSSDTVAIVRQGLQPLQKMPPSPAYLLFYGGAALVIASVCFARRPRIIIDPLVTWTATIGRASLMCFVAQDWLLLGVPAVFGFSGFDSLLFWAAYVVAVIVLLQWLARLWDARRANRFLTIGLKSFCARQRASAHHPAHEMAPARRG